MSGDKSPGLHQWGDMVSKWTGGGNRKMMSAGAKMVKNLVRSNTAFDSAGR